MIELQKRYNLIERCLPVTVIDMLFDTDIQESNAWIIDKLGNDTYLKLREECENKASYWVVFENHNPNNYHIYKTFNDIKSINIQEELDNCIKVIKEKSQELTQHNKEFADSSERLFKENVENRLVSYKKRVENLEFQAMLEDSEKILNDQLKQIDNFSESLRAKLQNLADTYLEFAKDLDTRIKDDNSKFLDAYINSVNSSSKELSSSIESFNATKKEYQVFVKEQNNFLKRSKYVSVFVSSLFGIGIGVSVAFWLYMSQELDNIANYSNQLASIKIIKNDENLVLELPNDADYSNKNGEKRITLKKVKNEL